MAVPGGGLGTGEQAPDPGDQLGDAGTGGGRPGEDRVQVARPGLLGDQRHQLVRRTVLAVDVRREQRVVVLGQRDRLPFAEGAVVVGVRREGGGPRPEPGRDAHRQDRRREPGPDGVEHRVDVGADPVDLVDEQQRRHAEPLQRAHQDPGLRLHALDRGQHEDAAVEHTEDALDLGDEVGVPGGVDDVDDEVVEGERHDGGLDGDAATALEREAVGPGGAGVDGAGLVDHPGQVEQPFGEGGLTGVDVGEDAQVERPAGPEVDVRGAREVPSRRWMRTGACVARISGPPRGTSRGVRRPGHRRQPGRASRQRVMFGVPHARGGRHGRTTTGRASPASWRGVLVSAPAPVTAAAATCAGVPATIVGTTGDDELTGTPGDDVIAALEGNDVIDGGAGNDLVCGDAGADRLTGGDGNDRLYGGDNGLVPLFESEPEPGGDTLVPGPGDDLVDVGVNTVLRGDGYNSPDTIDYSASATGVTVDLVSGVATRRGQRHRRGRPTHARSGAVIELIGSNHADHLLGTEGPDQLVGNGGGDRIEARGGDDLVMNAWDEYAPAPGENADDYFDGGAGDDYLDSTGGADVLLGGDGPDHIRKEGGPDHARRRDGARRARGLPQRRTPRPHRRRGPRRRVARRPQHRDGAPEG